MKLSKKIWDELGALSAHVELLDHENGLAKYRDGTTDPQKASVEAVIAAHDPDTPSASEVAEQAEREAVKQLQSATKADAMFKALEKADAAQIANWIDTQFAGMTAQQRALLKLLTQVAAMVLRERA